MVSRQKVNLIDFVFFMIIEDLYVFIVQQVEIDFVTVIANSHDKSSLHVEGIDFLMERQLSEFFFTHGLTRLHFKVNQKWLETLKRIRKEKISDGVFF